MMLEFESLATVWAFEAAEGGGVLVAGDQVVLKVENIGKLSNWPVSLTPRADPGHISNDHCIQLVIASLIYTRNMCENVKLKVQG